MRPADAFPLLRAFFYEWLVQQRNVSAHTIRSYRDAWRLFLRFVAARRHCRVADLTLAALDAGEVAAFLQYSECERKVSIGTRNCRLAALRSFFAFVAEREPAAIAQCTEVLRIPTKKAPKPARRDLEFHEIEAILEQPDRGLLEGQRDHALLWFLYNTGARIQEALDVLLPTFISTHRGAFACSARGARSASAPCGRRRPSCSRRCCSASRVPAMNGCSSIVTRRRSAHRACASSSRSTSAPLPEPCRR